MNTMIKMILPVSLLFLLAGSPLAYADAVGYNKVVDLQAETKTLRAEHHHDWSKDTHDSRWKMISTNENPFTADNDYAFLRLFDKVTGAELFLRPVPALTYIWISPDSKYVVGVSNIMAWNPYQLVVFSKSGARLLERNMVGVDWPGVTQSMTNWIKWYKEPEPKITIVESDKYATLSVEDTRGVLRQFQFEKVRIK